MAQKALRILQLLFSKRAQRLMVGAAFILTVIDMIITNKLIAGRVTLRKAAGDKEIDHEYVLHQYTVFIIIDLLIFILLSFLKTAFKRYNAIYIDKLMYKDIRKGNVTAIRLAPSEVHVTELKIASSALLRALCELLFELPQAFARMVSICLKMCFSGKGYLSRAVAIMISLFIHMCISVMAVASREKRRKVVNDRRAKMAEWAGLTFECVDVIKAYGIEEDAERVYREKTNSYHISNYKYLMISEMYRMAQRLIFYILSLVVIYDKLTDSGFFVGVSVIQVFEQIRVVRMEILRLRNALFFFCEHWGEMAVEKFQDEVESKRETSNWADGEINSTNVILTAAGAPAGKGKNVVAKIQRIRIPNCVIKKGVHTRITGEKLENLSHFLCALAGLYSYSGHLRIGGVEVAELSVGILKTRVSLLVQKQELFSRSVLFNIAFGTGLNTEEVPQRIKEFGLEKYLNLVGLDTQVGPGGCNLSVGQRQLVCFTRAIVRERDIYLLDEPFAFMDSETRKAAIRALKQLKNKTVVVVSQGWYPEDAEIVCF